MVARGWLSIEAALSVGMMCLLTWRQLKGAVPSGLVGLPLECLGVPEGDGTLTGALYRLSGRGGFCLAYRPGVRRFELPAWNQWYWVGGWEGDELVFSCWLRHVLEE